MDIGLKDVDGGKFPNLALMKIARWHRMQGDDVEWADPMFGRYDRVYKSKVFNFTPDDDGLQQEWGGSIMRRRIPSCLFLMN